MAAGSRMLPRMVMDPSTPFAKLWDRVLGVFAEDPFLGRASGFDRRPLITIANGLGGPRMRLLHWRTLGDLGRLPRSDEGHAVDALAGIDAYGAPQVEVFMVSHRWLRPSLDPTRSHPDGPDHEKARAVHQFSLWRRQWVLHQHGFLPEIFYWIDYSCIDQ